MTNKRGMVMEMNDSEGIIITSDRGKEKETIAEHLALAEEGDSANTLEFICNYLNKNTGNYSENMSGSAGSDAYHGKAYIITEGALISGIDLLIGKEIEWEEYFGYNY